MAILKVGVDTSDDFGFPPAVYSHTLVAGADRIIIVCYAVENEFNTGDFSATYGGIGMAPTGGVAAVEGDGFYNGAIIFYIGEASLATLSLGSQTVSVTFNGSAASTQAYSSCAQYAGVEQVPPLNYTQGQTAVGATISNTIVAEDTDLVLSCVTSSETGTWTHNNSQNQIATQSGVSSSWASTDLIATGSITTQSSTTLGSVNRLARAAVVVGEMELFTDDFNRSNETPLSSPWSTVGSNGCDLASNAAIASTVGINISALLSSTFEDNQSALATIATLGAGDLPGVGIRFNSNNDGYYVEVAGDGTSIKIVRSDAGILSTIDQVFGQSIVATDTIEIVATGSTISGLINGVSLVSATDSTYTSGAPSIHFSLGGANASSLDNFSASGLILGLVVEEGRYSVIAIGLGIGI